LLIRLRGKGLHRNANRVADLSHHSTPLSAPNTIRTRASAVGQRGPSPLTNELAAAEDSDDDQSVIIIEDPSRSSADQSGTPDQVPSSTALVVRSDRGNDPLTSLSLVCDHL
jgi:hypothetical protein